MESLKQANFLIPETVLKELRTLVPRGEQSRVVSDALLHELKRRKLKKAIQGSFGAWKSRKDLGPTHSYIRKFRKERSF